MLGRVIDRARRIVGIDRIIVATSTESSDDAIAKFVEVEGVNCYRGDLNDVAGRAVGACEAFGLDGFSRICGDRPFLDPDIHSQLIALFHMEELDLATTTGETVAPPGLTAEIVRTSALKSALPALSAYDREHVTSYFYRRAGDFKVGSIRPPAYLPAGSSVRLVVDDATDLSRAQGIASGLVGSHADVQDMAQVILLAERWDRENPRMSV